MARPAAPERSTSSTSTVGLPRLSRTWRAWTFSIWLNGSTSFFVHSGLGVEGQLVVGRQRLPVGPGVLGKVLGGLDAPAEARAGRAQRQLGIDMELARDVDRGEEHVADLVEDRVALGPGGLELLELAADRVVGDAIEVEARGRGAPLDLARVQQRGQV